MCMVSMVMDHFEPFIPDSHRLPWHPATPSPNSAQPIDTAKLLELLESLRSAKAAAETFDRVTGQPDCVDPEKAKLEERVARLEKALNEDGDFVIAEKRTLEPGRYRVVGGRLYRLVEESP